MYSFSVAKIEIENDIDQRLLKSNNDDKGKVSEMAKVEVSYVRS